MESKLYVGNLPFSATDESLRGLFSQYGTVESAKVITDRDSGRSKGFGFVQMSSAQEASVALNGANGMDQDGRALKVSMAKPQAPRENRSGFGGGGFRRNQF